MSEFVGRFALAVAKRLRDRFAEARPDAEWATEYRLGTTPVDVAGRLDACLVLVELEWRRADPANNTAKPFRHAVEESIEADRVVVFLVFTRYYDLASGGVSSKRLNAEFVGQTAADTIDGLSYRPLTIVIDPRNVAVGVPRGGTR